METENIIALILIVGLVVERIMKHFKKSSCLGSTVEFDTNASAPNLSSYMNV